VHVPPTSQICQTAVDTASALFALEVVSSSSSA
jgi:hypothetical protein